MSAELSPAFWLAVTAACYFLARTIHRRAGAWWSSPLFLASALCLALGLILHVNYAQYMKGGKWLLMLLGPATVAFALPIYQQRALIRRHWTTLLFGLTMGCVLAIGGTWLMASLLGLSPELRLSMLPRSFTTPFAMAFAREVGGSPDLAAVCVICTGIVGASLGGTLLRVLPLRSSFARGLMFGMGAHGAGVARAREVGPEEEAVAGLVMALAGVACALIGALAAFVA